MGVNLWPADTLPYSGRTLRQLVGGLWGGKTPGRPLGGRSGVLAGSGSPATVSATATVWTVNPHIGVLDLEATASAGTYTYSVDAVWTGPMTPAHATLDRFDRIDIQLSDPAEGDGTAAPIAVPVYTAGVAGAGVPPAAPVRSSGFSTINVPHAGAGAPVVTFTAPYAVATGGILPCRSSAEYPASPYEGQYVDDLALNCLMRFDGALWVPASLGAWTSYTPFLGNWTLGAGTNGSRWTQIGKQVTAHVYLASGAGVAFNSSGVTIGLPIASSASGGRTSCPMTVFTGSAAYTAWAIIPTGGSSTASVLVTTGPTDPRLVPMTATTPNVPNGGDFFGTLVYEAA
jgi:hypothetical protein